jgi:preprotein translocase subunit SecD
MKKLLILTVAAILTGCTTMRNPGTAVTLEFRPGSQSPGSGLTEMTVPGSKTPVYISEDVALSNADVQSTRVLTGPNGHQQIEIVFTKVGAERFAATTERLTGKPLGILVDGKLISAPVVMDKISGGKAIITGGFSVEEAKRIADGITGQ